jgi:hypothetical protein
MPAPSDDDALRSLRELRAADERRRAAEPGSIERLEAEHEVEALARSIFEHAMGEGGHRDLGEDAEPDAEDEPEGDGERSPDPLP